MRMAMRFDTGAKKYGWLNQSLFLSEGRLAGPKEIEYRYGATIWERTISHPDRRARYRIYRVL